MKQKQEKVYLKVHKHKEKLCFCDFVIQVVFKTIFRLSFELRNPVVKVEYSFYLVVPCAYKTLAAEKQYDSFPYKLRLLCAFRTMHVLGYPFLKLYSKD